MSLIEEIRMPAKDRRKAIYVIYFVAFFDLFAVSLFLPLLARQIKELGAGTLLIGIVGSVYGGIQLISSPIMGRWSDVYGRKKLMIYTLLFSAFGYVLQGLNYGIILFLIARIFAGIFKHTQTIGKNFLPELAPHQKSYVLGNFNAFGSMGYILGPTVGAWLISLEGGFQNVCLLAALAFVLNAVFISVFVPESLNRGKKKADSDMSPLLKEGSIESLWKTSAYTLIIILLLRFLFSFATLAPRANLPLILEEKYQTSILSMGYLGSFQALISTISGFAVGPINSKIFKEKQKRIVIFGGIIQFVSLLGLYLAPSYRLAGLSLLLLSSANPYLRVGITALSLEYCADAGTILGLGQTASSLSRMISPFASSLAQEYISIDGPALVGAISAFLGVFFTLTCVAKSSTATRNRKEYVKKSS